MASKAAATRPLAQLSGSMSGVKQAAQRSFATVQNNKSPLIQQQQPRRASTIITSSSRFDGQQQQWRRGFAEKLPDAKQVKRGSWKTLKWTWRITYLSVLGTLAYTGYQIYNDRHPEDQQAPDPNKKTLVVLGRLGLFFFSAMQIIAGGVLHT